MERFTKQRDSGLELERGDPGPHELAPNPVILSTMYYPAYQLSISSPVRNQDRFCITPKSRVTPVISVPVIFLSILEIDRVS